MHVNDTSNHAACVLLLFWANNETRIQKTSTEGSLRQLETRGHMYKATQSKF